MYHTLQIEVYELETFDFLDGLVNFVKSAVVWCHYSTSIVNIIMNNELPLQGQSF